MDRVGSVKERRKTGVWLDSVLFVVGLGRASYVVDDAVWLLP